MSFLKKPQLEPLQKHIHTIIAMIIQIQAELLQPPKKLLNKQSKLKPPQPSLPPNNKKNAMMIIIQVQLSSKNLKSSIILPPILKNKL